MDKKEMVCIVCPLGCRLTVTKNDDEYTVTGNKCNRGKEYAIKEMTNPTRVLTTTVRIKDGLLNRIPVKTNKPVPKDKIFECMQIINSIEVQAPIKMGEIIIKDILGTGADIVASRSMIKQIG
ncbi:CxxC motif-containing protein [Caminicella sporogenes DSM 14501]|uniref:CxxC motif-containing protein n=1 Tax=Caminicella sporogenes DSM 14501 TaxID=1121266 RepID=A0A1M6Q6E4_9FIRM|nr:DUF1667 domain-containing protein [Caminicella sporogenes]RKD23594.1 molybdopterin oxidoreductase [Caminicella sporogenes]SHK15844.1 CxxC motif-containing protein [Caminicella sporogenes DSM 14501]